MNNHDDFTKRRIKRIKRKRTNEEREQLQRFINEVLKRVKINNDD
jgi:hypothetical protein